nr:MAG TPA: hypothetical protein [Caudoviricetes sp.]
MGLSVRDKPFPRVRWRVSSAEPPRVKRIAPDSAMWSVSRLSDCSGAGIIYTA